MENESKSVAIVIPVYKKQPSELEQLSYVQCIKILHKYDIYLVVPEDLDCSFYVRYGNVHVKKFAPGYFKGLKGYNKLLLSSFFYEEFATYKYILIYQLDCFVFKDELEYWCSKNYDYVGAPWINVEWLPRTYKTISNFTLKKHGRLARAMKKVRWKMGNLTNPANLSVGNGGLSLRNVSTCTNATKQFKKQILQWPYNEDYFFCIFLPLVFFEFHRPSPREAAFFSFDMYPNLCYELTNNELPFGCHAWYRNDYPYNNLKFWEPIVQGLVGNISAIY